MERDWTMVTVVFRNWRWAVDDHGERHLEVANPVVWSAMRAVVEAWAAAEGDLYASTVGCNADMAEATGYEGRNLHGEALLATVIVGIATTELEAARDRLFGFAQDSGEQGVIWWMPSPGLYMIEPGMPAGVRVPEL